MSPVLLPAAWLGETWRAAAAAATAQRHFQPQSQSSSCRFHLPLQGNQRGSEEMHCFLLLPKCRLAPPSFSSLPPPSTCGHPGPSCGTIRIPPLGCNETCFVPQHLQIARFREYSAVHGESALISTWVVLCTATLHSLKVLVLLQLFF